MKVLFFAQSREITRTDHYVLKADRPLTQPEFWSQLIEIFPGLSAQQKTTRLARNETYLQTDELINPEDEIAVIPPVSGG